VARNVEVLGHDLVPLADGLVVARVSYNVGLRLLLTGAWVGEKVGQRWMVDPASVRKWVEGRRAAGGSAK
jgi:hypothetical protein